MSALTVEDLFKILDEKLEENFEKNVGPLNTAIHELKTQVEDAMEHILLVNAKYDELWERVDRLGKEDELIKEDNKVLKICLDQLDQSMIQLEQNCNDLEEYNRRDCVEISAIPPPVWNEENVTNVVIKMGELEYR